MQTPDLKENKTINNNPVKDKGRRSRKRIYLDFMYPSEEARRKSKSQHAYLIDNDVKRSRAVVISIDPKKDFDENGKFIGDEKNPQKFKELIEAEEGVKIKIFAHHEAGEDSINDATQKQDFSSKQVADIIKTAKKLGRPKSTYEGMAKKRQDALDPKKMIYPLAAISLIICGGAKGGVKSFGQRLFSQLYAGDEKMIYPYLIKASKEIVSYDQNKKTSVTKNEGLFIRTATRLLMGGLLLGISTVLGEAVHDAFAGALSSPAFLTVMSVSIAAILASISMAIGYQVYAAYAFEGRKSANEKLIYKPVLIEENNKKVFYAAILHPSRAPPLMTEKMENDANSTTRGSWVEFNNSLGSDVVTSEAGDLDPEAGNQTKRTVLSKFADLRTPLLNNSDRINGEGPELKMRPK